MSDGNSNVLIKVESSDFCPVNVAGYQAGQEFELAGAGCKDDVCFTGITDGMVDYSGGVICSGLTGFLFGFIYVLFHFGVIHVGCVESVRRTIIWRRDGVNGNIELREVRLGRGG